MSTCHLQVQKNVLKMCVNQSELICACPNPIVSKLCLIKQ